MCVNDGRVSDIFVDRSDEISTEGESYILMGYSSAQ